MKTGGDGDDKKKKKKNGKGTYHPRIDARARDGVGLADVVATENVVFVGDHVELDEIERNCAAGEGIGPEEVHFWGGWRDVRGGLGLCGKRR